MSNKQYTISLLNHYRYRPTTSNYVNNGKTCKQIITMWLQWGYSITKTYVTLFTQFYTSISLCHEVSHRLSVPPHIIVSVDDPLVPPEDIGLQSHLAHSCKVTQLLYVKILINVKAFGLRDTGLKVKNKITVESPIRLSYRPYCCSNRNMSSLMAWKYAY